MEGFMTNFVKQRNSETKNFFDVNEKNCLTFWNFFSPKLFYLKSWTKINRWRISSESIQTMSLKIHYFTKSLPIPDHSSSFLCKEARWTWIIRNSFCEATFFIIWKCFVVFISSDNEIVVWIWINFRPRRAGSTIKMWSTLRPLAQCLLMLWLKDPKPWISHPWKHYTVLRGSIQHFILSTIVIWSKLTM